jgi:hypothetical protein
MDGWMDEQQQQQWQLRLSRERERVTKTGKKIARNCSVEKINRARSR